MIEIPSEHTNPVNLWDEPITLAELRIIVAMLVAMKDCQIVRGLETGTLWIKLKGT